MTDSEKEAAPEPEKSVENPVPKLCLCGVRGCPDYVKHHRQLRASTKRWKR